MNHYLMLAKLLNYPTTPLYESLDEIQMRVRDQQNLGHQQKEAILSFVHYAQSLPLLDWEALYINTFEMQPDTSLHLTHYLNNEAHEQSLTMTNLTQHCQTSCWEIANRELPDFLPLILEFLSLQPKSARQQFLDQASRSIRIVFEKLNKRSNIYARLLQVLIAESNRISTRSANSFS